MMSIYHFDYETFSPVDIKTMGVFKYAAHPEAEILIAAIAKDDEPPVAWSAMDDNLDFLMLLQEAIESGAEIWAHNAQFEFAITKNLFTKTFHMEPPALEQWRCTATLCRLAAIPSSLEDAGEFLSIPMPKDKDGTRLIQKFCAPRKPTKNDPRPRINPADEPGEFQRFVDYCVRDVEAEREIHAKLGLIGSQKNPTWSPFQADLRMNDRGIPVNVKALKNADRLIKEYSTRLVPQFRAQVATPGTILLPVTTTRKVPKPLDISEGFNPTQREAMLVWLAERGFSGSDLQQDTVERWLAEPLASQLTPQARAALHTYSLVGSAAVKKIPAMLARAGADGYIRGALMIYGAERTHRWTGKGIQPQNFARPVIGHTGGAYAAICDGWGIDDLEDIYGPLYPILVSCIRHFIQPHGDQVLQADYSAIEARIAPWLCLEEATLQMFREGAPLYERMAGLIFHKNESEVNKDERFIGKQSVLGCSYNMGRPKFRATCESYGFTPPPEMVEAYKPRHAAFVARAVEGTKGDVRRKFGKKGVPIPAKYDNPDYYAQRTMQDNKWTTLDPQTDDEWASFAFDDLADRAVTTWRANNPKIVSMWRELGTAAKLAIESCSGEHTAGRIKLKMLHEGALGFPCLAMRLPSGHHLIYPHVSVEKNESRGWGTQIRFWGVIPNSGGKWGWCYTYGGKLLENATQATAGDVMREGFLAAEAEGYEPFMLVHDEMLAIQKDGQTHERLCELLCSMPGWADGLPLAAEGATLPFYQK